MCGSSEGNAGDELACGELVESTCGEFIESELVESLTGEDVDAEVATSGWRDWSRGNVVEEKPSIFQTRVRPTRLTSPFVS